MTVPAKPKPGRIKHSEFKAVRFEEGGDAPYMELFVFDEDEYRRSQVGAGVGIVLLFAAIFLLIFGFWMLPVLGLVVFMIALYFNSQGVPDGRQLRLRVFIDEVQVWEMGNLKHAIPWSRLNSFYMKGGFFKSDKVRLDTDEGTVELRLATGARQSWLSAVRVLCPGIWDVSAPKKHVIKYPGLKLAGFGLLATASCLILVYSPLLNPWVVAVLILTFFVAGGWAAAALVSMLNGEHLAGMSLEEAGHCAHDITTILPIMDAESHRYRYAAPGRIMRIHRFWKAVSWLVRVGGLITITVVFLLSHPGSDAFWSAFIIFGLLALCVERLRCGVAAVDNCADAELIIRDRKMFLKLSPDSEEILVESKPVKDSLTPGLRLKSRDGEFFVIPGKLIEVEALERARRQLDKG